MKDLDAIIADAWELGTRLSGWLARFDEPEDSALYSAMLKAFPETEQSGFDYLNRVVRNMRGLAWACEAAGGDIESTTHRTIFPKTHSAVALAPRH